MNLQHTLMDLKVEVGTYQDDLQGENFYFACMVRVMIPPRYGVRFMEILPRAGDKFRLKFW